MSKELIERLRNFELLYRDDDVKLMAEAADRIAELERENANMKQAGGLLANIAYNLAQTPARPLSKAICADLDEARKKWDATLTPVPSPYRAENEALHAQLVKEKQAKG